MALLVLGVLALANLAGMASGSKVGVFNGARHAWRRCNGNLNSVTNFQPASAALAALVS